MIHAKRFAVRCYARRAALALKRIFIMGAIAGTLAGAPAWARPQAYISLSYQTGNSLLALCTSAVFAEVEACLGYVEAVAEAITHTTNRTYFGFDPKGTTIVPIEPPPQRDDREIPILACLPSGPTGPTGNQLKDIVVHYLRANPAWRHTTAFNLVEFALQGAYPCPP